MAPPLNLMPLVKSPELLSQVSRTLTVSGSSVAVVKRKI